MNDDFASLFAYNRWADRRVLDVCRTLTAEQYAAEPSPGWTSVRTTLVHLAVVTEGWLRGLAGETVTSVLSEAEMPTVDEAARLLDRANQIFETLGPSISAEWLVRPMTLGGRGRTATLPPWMVLRHLVNHATYHRGQIASKLGRLGVEPPATDLIFWALEQVPQTS